MARITRLTLLTGLPHSLVWREGNGFLYLSSLPLSLPLSLPSGHLECCSCFSENKYALSLNLNALITSVFTSNEAIKVRFSPFDNINVLESKIF